MDLLQFSHDFSELSASERAYFSDVISRLFKDGILDREEDSDRKAFNFILQNKTLIDEYLAVAGWTLIYHERLHLLQLFHKDGAHRKRFNKEQTIWLLILRMIYAEKREQQSISFTRNPVCRTGELVEWYSRLIPGKNLRKKSSLEEALRLFHGLKLVRPAGSRFFMGFDPDEIIELLPALEVVLPASKLAELRQRLEEVMNHADSE